MFFFTKSGDRQADLREDGERHVHGGGGSPGGGRPPAQWAHFPGRIGDPGV